MLGRWLGVGTVALGLSLVGCDDGQHDGDDALTGSGDNLKGRDKAPADAALRHDAAAPEDASIHPCAALLCPVQTQCVVKNVQCVRAPCPPVASCEPSAPEPVDAAAPASCAATLCKQGTTCVDGPSGAACVELACTAKCSAAQHCELKPVVCIKAPCDPVPTCVDDLDACAALRCRSGTHCELKQVQCITTPCEPVAECVAD